MEYRNLGRSGLKVSQMSLGCNAFGPRCDEATGIALVHAALDAGINLLDTADTYGLGSSETILGKALHGRRSKVILATKVSGEVGKGPLDRGLSRQHILDGVDASLRRLQTDYIDLYQAHFFDPTTPLEESLRALDDLVRWGKVRYIGCSNFAAWQLVKALGIQERHDYARFVSHQPEYSPANRKIERELVPAALAEGIGLIVFFPLAAGVLTGKYKPGEPPPPGSRVVITPRFASWLSEANFALVERMSAVAAQAELPLPRLTLAWVMQKPGITAAITGATRVEQLLENLQACEVKLPADVVAAVDAASVDRT